MGAGVGYVGTPARGARHMIADARRNEPTKLTNSRLPCARCASGHEGRRVGEASSREAGASVDVVGGALLAAARAKNFSALASGMFRSGAERTDGRYGECPPKDLTQAASKRFESTARLWPSRRRRRPRALTLTDKIK